MVRISFLITICFIWSGISSQVAAQQRCFTCYSPSTISEIISGADAVVLVDWKSSRKRKGKDPGESVFEVKQVWKQSKETVKVGVRITVHHATAGEVGKQYVLFGYQGATFYWASPLAVSNSCVEYLIQAPSPEDSPQVRLSYYLSYLENPDLVIAQDAYSEVCFNISKQEIQKSPKNIPAKKIREWFVKNASSSERTELYGILLGIAGTDDDAEMMEKKLLKSHEKFRFNIYGVMSGYLLLKGEKGLKVLEETKLENKKACFAETYAVMQTLRFLWTLKQKRITKQRIRQSMRNFLNNPDLADLAIADLAGFEDWSIQQRLMKMYEKKEFDIPAVKRSIIRFMLDCSHSHDNKKGAIPKHVVQAGTNLETLRWLDPLTVKNTEKYYFLK